MPKRPPGNAWGYVPYRVRQRIRKQVFARDGYRCRIQGPGCTGRAEEVDHIVSLKKGGALLELSNIRAACKVCNQTRAFHEQVRREARTW